jgi:tRNA modification GTPase
MPDPAPQDRPAPPDGLLPQHRDAIVAVATAGGRGAVGIVRASGRDLRPLIDAVCGRALPPRRAVLLPFLDAEGAMLDRGLALHFPAPGSVTGEEVLELQAHGGPVLLQLLLTRCLQAQPGLRLAAPGEFTERAFLNGKLDLAQAEAVADLIDAGTEAAARSAARSLQGAFSAAVNTLAEGLVRLRTLVEATLDFPEEDIDFLERADARGQLAALQASLGRTLAHTRQGALLREGLTVVLAGQPNVGKSSLLNALAGAERAIVTPVAGTTRDRIEQSIQIEGVPLHVVDTAGLRDEAAAADAVERIGIARSWEAIAAADAVILLHDLTRRGQPDYDAADARIAAALLQHGVGSERLLPVFNKTDAASATVMAALPADALCIAARSGQGLEALRRALLQRAGWQPAAEGLFSARARHVHALQRAADHLALGAAHLQAQAPALELLAEELRLAHRALGEITGQFGVEDLLGEIFGRFCIGK